MLGKEDPPGTLEREYGWLPGAMMVFCSLAALGDGIAGDSGCIGWVAASIAFGYIYVVSRRRAKVMFPGLPFGYWSVLPKSGMGNYMVDMYYEMIPQAELKAQLRTAADTLVRCGCDVNFGGEMATGRNIYFSIVLDASDAPAAAVKAAGLLDGALRDAGLAKTATAVGHHRKSLTVRFLSRLVFDQS